MRWIAIFTNRPDTDALRDEHLAEHLEYFSQHDEISLAGSTTPYGQEHSTGGVWILKGVSYETAVKICEEDPFFIVGLRQTIDVLEFKIAPKFEERV